MTTPPMGYFGKANANGWQERTEVLWSNRPLGRQLELLGGVS